VDGEVTVGMTGTTGLGATMGDTLTIGTAVAVLTPRLPISIDPSGMPVRAPPPGVVGDVDAGVDEETTLLDPAPHIPDTPAVCTIPGVADIPDVATVAGATLPTAIPPPSKLDVDPNIPEGEVPSVEHVVPLPGIDIAPVAPGAGLTPGDAISVAPRGMPV
jgi:hypothetical protein